jgi:hypothetical protein
MKHELSLMVSFEEGPCLRLYNLRGQDYMEILARYELRSPIQIILG